MLHEKLIKSGKIALGVFFAILIARYLNLEFYTSVGTIVIVSMLSSKRQSLKLTGLRILTAIVSIGISSILFLLFGFSLGVFALYVFIFTFLMYQFDLKVTIVINIVLGIHIYSVGEISGALLLNEMYLVSLGTTTSLIFNYYTPHIEKELLSYQEKVEDQFNLILKNMGKCLLNECNVRVVSDQLDDLNNLLGIAKKRSYKHLNSYYIRTENFYVEYFTMRKQQYYILRNMEKFLDLNFLIRSEVELLKSFTDEFLYKNNSIPVTIQLQRLEEIKEYFNNADLPSTHAQFKNRIALNQYLYSVEELITSKMKFVENFPETEEHLNTLVDV